MGEMIPGSLNLFTEPSTLLSISEFRYQKVQTRTALDGDTPVLEFSAPADRLMYTNLNESYLMVKCRYVLADGTAIGAAPTVGPVQNPLTSIFKTIEMSMNDVKVFGGENNMQYVNFLHLFSQSRLAKESYLTTSLWYDDTYSKTPAPMITTANQPNPQAANVVNKGLKKRADYFGASKQVILIGKIFIPPHNTNRLILPNVKCDWKMEMAPMNFFTMSSDPVVHTNSRSRMPPFFCEG